MDIPTRVQKAEWIAWYNVRDVLFGMNMQTANVGIALNMLRASEWRTVADAVWLAGQSGVTGVNWQEWCRQTVADGDGRRACFAALMGGGNDEAKLLQAALWGYPLAQAEIAWHGNKKLAASDVLDWATKAAAGEEREGYYRLGYLLSGYTGQEYPVKAKKARRLLRRAVLLGHVESLRLLARFFEVTIPGADFVLTAGNPHFCDDLLLYLHYFGRYCARKESTCKVSFDGAMNHTGNVSE